MLDTTYGNKHNNTLRHETPYKQLGGTTNRTSYLYRNRNGHHTILHLKVMKTMIK